MIDIPPLVEREPVEKRWVVCGVTPKGSVYEAVPEADADNTWNQTDPALIVMERTLDRQAAETRAAQYISHLMTSRLGLVYDRVYLGAVMTDEFGIAIESLERADSQPSEVHSVFTI